MVTKKPTTRPSAPGFERPLVTVDVVIFTVIEEQLKVLLVRRPETAADPFPGRIALPGGFINVNVDASLHDCALRKLGEKTGFKTPYLEQLGSWGSATRDPRGWCATHVYFALVPPPEDSEATGLAVSAASAASEWVEVDTALRKRLAFDHAEILAAAVERLRGKVEYAHYFLAGDLMHKNYQKLNRNGERRGRLSQNNRGQLSIYFCTWLGFLAVTAEGFKNLRVRSLLQSDRPPDFVELLPQAEVVGKAIKEHDDALRRFRNKIFHLRDSIEELERFFSERPGRLEWAEALHSTFAEFFSDYRILCQVHYAVQNREQEMFK